MKLSPSPPFKTVRESNSTSPLALTPPRDLFVASESSNSLFCPIPQDFNVSNNNNNSNNNISTLNIANENSPSPPYKPVRTQVAVEVHQQLQNNAAAITDASSTNSVTSDEQNQHLANLLERARSSMDPPVSSWRTTTPALSRTKGQHRAMYSNSTESSNPSHHNIHHRDRSRRAKSYEDYAEDYDILKITEFSKGPSCNTDYETAAELGSPSGSKVRYNDTGSLEQLNEDVVVEDGLYAIGGVFGGDSRQRRKPKAKLVGGSVEEHDQEESNCATFNGNRKYRALWVLRATLEEEEECSDTVRMEDMTSPDDSPDREHATPNTTSFESNALSDPCPSDHRDSGIQFESLVPKQPSHANLLHPNYEHRRQNYRNVMNHRLQRGNHQSTSVENSFDSIETDGDVSDTSRYELTTTSFESTTDNTDSTTESQACRLQQMKADSGYKSLEAQQQGSKEVADSEAGQSSGAHAHISKDTRRELLRSNLDKNCNNLKNHWRDIELEGTCVCQSGSSSAPDPCAQRHRRDISPDANCASSKMSPSTEGAASGAVSAASASAGPPLFRKSPPQASHFDRRNAKTASKKRREYSSRERPVHVYESINEPETDSRSDLHSGDSFEDSSLPNKASLFHRFFKSHSRGHKSQYLVRDYSIDEKTNSIFNEFVRQEIPTASSSRDQPGSGRIGVRRSPRIQRHRFHRKHTEPSFLNEERLTRRDRLAPTIRSASLGSDSSASSARRISPQDSIEEEEDEIDIDEAVAAASSSSAFDRYSSSVDRPREVTFFRQFRSIGLRDIPIIRLPDDECQENA